MKEVIIIVLALSSFQLHAQDEVQKNKIATFGFDLGVNRSNLAFGSDQDGAGYYGVGSNWAR